MHDAHDPCGYARDEEKKFPEEQAGRQFGCDEPGGTPSPVAHWHRRRVEKVPSGSMAQSDGFPVITRFRFVAPDTKGMNHVEKVHGVSA